MWVERERERERERKGDILNIQSAHRKPVTEEPVERRSV